MLLLLLLLLLLLCALRLLTDQGDKVREGVVAVATRLSLLLLLLGRVELGAWAACLLLLLLGVRGRAGRGRVGVAGGGRAVEGRGRQGRVLGRKAWKDSKGRC